MLRLRIVENTNSGSSSLAVKRLQNENETLKAECRQLEMAIYRMQKRVDELRDALTTAESERDSIRFSEHQNTSSDPGSIELHPMVVHYNRTIADLKAKLQELEDGAARPTDAISRMNSRNFDLHLHSKVNETIEKAKQGIQRDLELIKQKRSSPSRNSHSRASTSGQGVTSSGDEDEMSDTDSMKGDRDTSFTDADRTNPTAAEDEMLSMLEQIQSDITIKEELVEQLERTQNEYQVMRDKYEEKLRQLQDNLVSIQRERDSAVKSAEHSDTKDKVRILLTLPTILFFLCSYFIALNSVVLFVIFKASIVKLRYEERIKKLTNEIGDIRRRYQEAQREMQSKRASNDNLIKSMKAHVETLKTEKMRMLKRVKEKEVMIKEREIEKDREITKLKRKEKQVMELARKLERSNHMHVRDYVVLCVYLLYRN